LAEILANHSDSQLTRPTHRVYRVPRYASWYRVSYMYVWHQLAIIVYFILFILLCLFNLFLCTFYEADFK